MNTPSRQQQHQVQVLSALLALEKEARKAESITELAYIMANDTHRLLPYSQAVVWRNQTAGRVSILSVSGVSNHDKHAVYLQWLASVIPRLCRDASKPLYIVDTERFPDELARQWRERQPGHALLCPFGDEGGLLLLRDDAWSEPESVVLDPLVDAYSHAWHALSAKETGPWRTLGQKLADRKLRLLLPALILAPLFLPVRFTVLAPAEIVPIRPFVVAAPMEGVVKTIEVAPNQAIEAGRLLFSLDTTTLLNRHLVAQKTLEVARADYLRAGQQAFASAQAQTEVQFLKAKVEQQEAETKYSKALLEKAQVRAQRSGIAVFTDPDYWQGRPVHVGEKVMTIADPRKVEIQIWLPVADAVALEPGARVRLFLNTAPNAPIEGELYRSAYTAETRPDQTLAFRLRARLINQAEPPRIGLKGTAKLYGERVFLVYYLLRRPYAALRQLIGL